MQYFQCKASQQCSAVSYYFTILHYVVFPTLTNGWNPINTWDKVRFWDCSVLLKTPQTVVHCTWSFILDQFGQLHTKGSGATQGRLAVSFHQNTQPELGAARLKINEQPSIWTQSGSLTCETQNCFSATKCSTTIKSNKTIPISKCSCRTYTVKVFPTHRKTHISLMFLLTANLPNESKLN